MIIKSISQTVEDVDVEKGIVKGYFSRFGNIDSDGDIVQKGAFKKTAAENFARIKHLLDHDTTKAVGVLQTLEEDNVGLAYVSKAGRHTLGRDFLLMAEDGIITEHSWRGSQMKGKYDETLKANVMTEIKMVEGSSLQAWGANELTPITSVKSESDLQELLTILEKALKSGKYSDETFKNQIIPQYEAIQKYFTEAVIEDTPAEPVNELEAWLFN
jgi:HK97 family phage prohead protease